MKMKSLCSLGAFVDLINYIPPLSRFVRCVYLGQVTCSRPNLKVKRKFDAKYKTYEERKPQKEAVIICKRSELNHYKSQLYNKFEPIPLASKGWHHRKSKGDYFIINAFTENPATSYSPENETSSFEVVGINAGIVNVLKKQEIVEPTKIQFEAIPAVLSGNHTLISSETGGGKTLAYLLPLIQQIISWKQLQANLGIIRKHNTPLGLVICPGRELAEQIGDVTYPFAKALSFSSKVLVGGRTKKIMQNPDFQDVDLLIATIGALSKLITTGIYKMCDVSHVVLDEADTLLDDSFNEKLLYILRNFQFCGGAGSLTTLPNAVQLTLVSATMPTSLPQILGEIIEVDSLQKITTGNLHHVMTHIPQKFIRLSKTQKPEELLKIAKANAKTGTALLIFSNKSSTCDWISLFLNENGVECINLNGAMPRIIREGKFKKFQTGQVDIISCTDIGSRGLDTIRVEHVLNYDFPVHMADYVHRCGRTGRVGSPENCHITNFVEGPREIELCQDIELSVRKIIALPNVNANIKRIITYKVLKSDNVKK